MMVATGAICVAVYRPDIRLLARQIASIRSQTLVDWMCIVGIDGADPDTARAVRELIDDDERFVLREYSENVGFYRNFERLLEEVPRDLAWVALSDQDDVWYPDKLARLVPELETSTLVVGSARLVDADGSPLGQTQRVHHGLLALVIDNQVTGSLCVFRRDLLADALPFPEPTDVAYHDHWLGVVAECRDGVRIDAHVVQDYVQHGANVIGEERDGVNAAARVSRLRSISGGGLRAALGYIADHRWGWRVNMARLALARGLRGRGPADQQALRSIARGSLSIGLSSAVLRAVRAHEVPAGRSFALLAGAGVAVFRRKRSGAASL